MRLIVRDGDKIVHHKLNHVAQTAIEIRTASFTAITYGLVYSTKISLCVSKTFYSALR